jgi:enoyl-CoA hydratase/carnithine racemase
VTTAPAGALRAGLRFDLGQPLPGAATVTLSRPERRNAMTPSMWQGLAVLGRSLPPEVRVVVVRGAGPSFCAGIDVRLLSGAEVPGEDPLPSPAAPGFDEWIAACQAGFSWLRLPSLVTVAAVQGHAIGAGFQLALACDLRLVAEDAQFSMAETSRGLVPDLGGTEALVHLVGYARAMEICLTGRRVGAEEAVALGLAAAIVPAAEVDAALEDLLAALLAAPRDAAVTTKRLLLRARENPGGRADQLAAEREAQVGRLSALARGADASS